MRAVLSGCAGGRRGHGFRLHISSLRVEFAVWNWRLEVRIICALVDLQTRSSQFALSRGNNHNFCLEALIYTLQPCLPSATIKKHPSCRFVPARVRNLCLLGVHMHSYLTCPRACRPHRLVLHTDVCCSNLAAVTQTRNH